ncbi:hypothetical protein [Chlamydiifrater volucris]|uniref:hypothetical protein n=1 Tax=Chlamydiifrater volucris TaxID=2681470 RepID=UPI001BD13898|nr:hypothetical protein [Chlamydiifrater volucris]
MSVSKLFEFASSTPTLSHSAPLEDRIRSNHKLIQEIVSTNPLDMTGTEGILCSQLYFAERKGFNFRLIAEALAISEISLRVILREQRSLSATEFNSLLRSCQDLSEASGSSSIPASERFEPSLQTPSLEEESAMEIEISTTPKRPLEKEELALPLKKRKIWTVLQPSPALSRPAPMESPPQHESKEAISLLMSTVINIRNGVPNPVDCPETAPHPRCDTCELSHYVASQRDLFLIKQLGILLLHTSKEVLTESIIHLMGQKRIAPLYGRRYFTSLEIAYLVDACRLGKEIYLSRKKDLRLEVNLYKIMEDVVRGGIRHPLAQALKELWDSPHPVKIQDVSIAVREADGSVNVLSVPLITAQFSSVTPRHAHMKKVGKKFYVSSTYFGFVAQATILSLKALLTTPKGAPFIESTDSDSVIFHKSTVQHIYSLILCCHPIWKVEVIPCKASPAFPQLLTLPEKQISELFPVLKKFVRVNGIRQTRGQYFDEEMAKEISGITAQESSEETASSGEEPSHSESSDEEDIAIRVSRAHHGEASPSSEVAEEILPLEEESVERQQTIRSVSFLLETLSRDTSSPQTCPDLTKHIPGESACFICGLSKLLLHKSYSSLLNQIKSLLEFTDKSRLIKALMKLFNGDPASELVKKGSFTNLEIACLLRDCKIGPAVCLPGKENPASLANLYCSVSKVISSGLEDPLTKAILEIWETSDPLISSAKETLDPPLVIKNDGSTHVCQPALLLPILTPVPQRYFDMRRGARKRGRLVLKMSLTTTNFIAKTTMFTIKALQESSLGRPFLKDSPSGPIFPWEVMEHIYCLILAAHPIWKLAILPCKVNPGGLQELSFLKEEIELIFGKLQRFTSINFIFQAGHSLVSARRREAET